MTEYMSPPAFSPPGTLSRPAPERVGAIDLARGLALVAMAVFHLAWDLSHLKFIATDIALHPGWRLFSHAIAGSFLCLAGVSLALAHGHGIRWRGFWRRLAIITLAALAVTAATRVAMPDSFVLFGILHCIALGSLLCLVLVRGPWWLPLPFAVAVAALPQFLAQPEWAGLQDRMESGPLFILWQHLGMGLVPPNTVDFVPLFPWAAWMLAGLSIGLVLTYSRLASRLASIQMPGLAAPLVWAGRHSLPVYLIHQPVLIGTLMALAWLAPGMTDTLRNSTVENVRNACVMECGMTRSAEVCAAGCNCMLEALRQNTSQYRRIVIEGRNDEDSANAIGNAAGICFKPAPSN